MPAPLAYHITWTTYGGWLPGDSRGWVERGTHGIQAPDEGSQAVATRALRTEPIRLDAAQREVVRVTIVEHCAIRGWRLHAVNVRSNHVHTLVTADESPEVVMNQFKAWSSRRLNEQAALRGTKVAPKHRWWTRHGSTKWINEEGYFQNVMRYIVDGQ
jgi:REP element-mobilizing transposase RayT